MEKVVLVDMNDNKVGLEEKLQAHENAKLHRAFSVFLFRGNELLIHKRASVKYHCGGLWTNTCCSHPRDGEEVIKAGIRRLREELGIEINELKEVSSFVYCYPFDNGLTEFEYDHILIGEYDGDFVINPLEVDEIRWISMDKLKKKIQENPSEFTPWFITALSIVSNYIK